jgi:hypothetical protein
MKKLIFIIIVALAYSCIRDVCKPSIPKGRTEMIKKLGREYNYKPYKK